MQWLVRLVLRVPLVPRAFKVPRAQLVTRALWQLALPVLLEQSAPPAHRALSVPQVFKVPASLVLLARWDRPVRPAYKV